MSSGRGPTIDISPRRTFTSCGSSSRLVRRRKRPTLVTRGSERILNIGSPRPSIETRSGSRASASRTIVRNLKILKRRPFSPARCCRKNTGKPSSITMAKGMSRNSGEVSMSPNVDDALQGQRRRRDVPGVVVEQRQVGDVPEVRGGAEDASRRRHDGELDAAQATGRQEPLEQSLVQLGARDDDAIHSLQLVELIVQLGAARDPQCDRGVNVREELELARDGLRKWSLADDQET